MTNNFQHIEKVGAKQGVGEYLNLLEKTSGGLRPWDVLTDQQTVLELLNQPTTQATISPSSEAGKQPGQPRQPRQPGQPGQPGSHFGSKTVDFSLVL